MANRIVQNVLIVDSAMGNAYILDPNSGGAVIDGKYNFRSLIVNAFMLVNDTSSIIQFADANTANIIMQLDKFNTMVHFADPQKFANLKVPALSAAGTAFIYLA